MFNSSRLEPGQLHAGGRLGAASHPYQGDGLTLQSTHLRLIQMLILLRGRHFSAAVRDKRLIALITIRSPTHNTYQYAC